MTKPNLHIFVIDTSHSMHRKDYHKDGSVGYTIAKKIAVINPDDYIAVITFNNNPFLFNEPNTITNFTWSFDHRECINKGEDFEKLGNYLFDYERSINKDFLQQFYYLITDYSEEEIKECCAFPFHEILPIEKYKIKEIIKDIVPISIPIITPILFAVGLMIFLSTIAMYNNREARKEFSKINSEFNKVNNKELATQKAEVIMNSYVVAGSNEWFKFDNQIVQEYIIEYPKEYFKKVEKGIVKDNILYYPNGKYNLDTIREKESNAIIVKMIDSVVANLNRIETKYVIKDKKIATIKITGEADGTPFITGRKITLKEKDIPKQEFICNGTRKYLTFPKGYKTNQNIDLACFRSYYLFEYLSKRTDILKNNKDNIIYYADTSKIIGGENRKTKIEVIFYHKVLDETKFNLICIILLLIFIIFIYFYRNKIKNSHTKLKFYFRNKFIFIINYYIRLKNFVTFNANDNMNEKFKKLFDVATETEIPKLLEILEKYFESMPSKSAFNQLKDEFVNRPNNFTLSGWKARFIVLISNFKFEIQIPDSSIETNTKTFLQATFNKPTTQMATELTGYINAYQLYIEQKNGLEEQLPLMIGLPSIQIKQQIEVLDNKIKEYRQKIKNCIPDNTIPEIVAIAKEVNKEQASEPEKKSLISKIGKVIKDYGLPIAGGLQLTKILLEMGGVDTSAIIKVIEPLEKMLGE